MTEAAKRVRSLLADDLEMKRRGPKSELPLIVLDLVMETGLSVSQVLSLGPDSIVADNRHLRVGDRLVAVPEPLWRRVAALAMSPGPTFSTRTGRALSANSVRRTWANIQKRNGLSGPGGTPRYSTQDIRGNL